MFGVLKIKLIAAIRSLQHVYATAVVRDDDGAAGDIATADICSYDDDD